MKQVSCKTTKCLAIALAFCVLIAFAFSGTGYAETSETEEPVSEQIVENESDAPEAQTENTESISEDPEDQVPGEIQDEEETEDDGENLIPVYRLFNPKTGEHLFTTSINETTVLYRKHGWNWEGIGWYAPGHGKAVYRLYHPGLNQHLFTTDLNEKKILSKKHGWSVDNNGRPLFFSGGELNIYRLYQQRSGAHHLTPDINEYKTLPEFGWEKEGAAFKAADQGRIPGSSAAAGGRLAVTGINGSTGLFKISGVDITSEIGIKDVRFAVWRDKDQNDIKWYTASENGDAYTATGNAANHRYHFGSYTVHMYVTLGNGVKKRIAATKFSIRPDNYVFFTYTDSGKTKAAVTIINPNIAGETASGVKIAVWSAEGGQDDLRWYTAKRFGDKAFQTVIDSAKHKRSGKYNVHIYGTASGSPTQIRRTSVVLNQGELTLRTQLDYLDAVQSTNQLAALRGAVLTASQRQKVNQAIIRVLSKRAKVGFVVMNLKSGKTLAYNAGMGTFGASTIKGPYITAVCRANPANWKASSGLMTQAIVVSNNQAYAALRHRYGGAAMKSLFELSRLGYKNPNQHYPNSNPRELAKLWCGTYSYLKQNQEMAKTLRGVFAKTGHSPINRTISETTFSKPGWMDIRPPYQYHDAGIVMSADGPYVIAVMTTLDGDDHATIDQLVRVLHEVQASM